MIIATHARDGSPRAVADTGRRVASLEVLNVGLDLDSPHLSTVAPASDAPAAPRTSATTATLVPPQASPSEEFGLLLALGFGIPVGFIAWLLAWALM